MTGAVTRRAVMTGAGAAILSPAWAEPTSADLALKSLLDEAAASTDLAAMVARLAQVDAAKLSPPARLDLITATSGLRIDAALLRQFPDPKGAMSPARYQLLLRRITSEDADLTLIDQRLTQERRALTARADRTMRRLGHSTGSVGARFTALWQDPRWRYSNDDTGRDRAVLDINRTLTIARKSALRTFPEVPSYCFDVTARRMSPADEASGRGGYRELPTATRAGAYFVDLKDIHRRPSWTLPSVVRHELLPGHMIQLPLEARAAPHPLRLKYAPGFAEGWAIHTERLALDQGAYADDPMAELGCLHWLLFRVGRALMDLRIHLSGWSLDKARAQLIEWQGEPAYFALFELDLKRIAAEPALRVAEAMAWLTMDDLGETNLAAFNRIALAQGRMRNDELRHQLSSRAG